MQSAEQQIARANGSAKVTHMRNRYTTIETATIWTHVPDTNHNQAIMVTAYLLLNTSLTDSEFHVCAFWNTGSKYAGRSTACSNFKRPYCSLHEKQQAAQTPTKSPHNEHKDLDGQSAMLSSVGTLITHTPTLNSAKRFHMPCTSECWSKFLVEPLRVAASAPHRQVTTENKYTCKLHKSLACVV